MDPCVATLAHPAEVMALAVSKTRIVSGAGNVVYLYDAATQEPLEELLGESKVTSIAIFEHGGQKGTGWIAVGYENGTIQVWDSGAKPPLTLTVLNMLGRATRASPRCHVHAHHVHVHVHAHVPLLAVPAALTILGRPTVHWPADISLLTLLTILIILGIPSTALPR
jgi:hypothetical protein